MNQKVADIRAEQWRQIIYECINREPKLSKKQWCRENGIYYRSFMYWQRKFQMEALGLMENHETTLPVNAPESKTATESGRNENSFLIEAGRDASVFYI